MKNKFVKLKENKNFWTNRGWLEVWAYRPRRNKQASLINCSGSTVCHCCLPLLKKKTIWIIIIQTQRKTRFKLCSVVNPVGMEWQQMLFFLFVAEECLKKVKLPPQLFSPKFYLPPIIHLEYYEHLVHSFFFFPHLHGNFICYFNCP